MHKVYSPMEIVEQFSPGRLAWGEVSGLLMDGINRQNVDFVIGSLPDELRKFFLEWARVNYIDDVDILHFGAPLSRESLAAIRDWMARNPP